MEINVHTKVTCFHKATSIHCCMCLAYKCQRRMNWTYWVCMVTANSANSSIMILSLCSHYDLITKVSDDCGHITWWLFTIYQWVCWTLNMLIWTSICSIIKLKNIMMCTKKYTLYEFRYYLLTLTLILLIIRLYYFDISNV